MPLKSGKLTGMERSFAHHMARTNDATYAATKAGYRSPMVRGSELMKKPDVAAEAAKRAMARLAELGDLAVSTVELCLTAKESTWTNKLTAADMVLKRLEARQGDATGKEPSEMTADELQAAINAAQLRLEAIAMGAKDVTPDPPDDPFA